MSEYANGGLIPTSGEEPDPEFVERLRLRSCHELGITPTEARELWRSVLDNINAAALIDRETP